MEELDLSPRNSAKMAREVLSRGQCVGRRRAWGAKRQETPKLPNDSELTLDSETRILSGSFSHVPHVSSIHLTPESKVSGCKDTPKFFPPASIFLWGV